MKDKNKFMVADPMMEGSIDDHLLVRRCDIGSDKNDCSKYHVIYRADFQDGFRPHPHNTSSVGHMGYFDDLFYAYRPEPQRGWKIHKLIAKDLCKEEALEVARVYALERNIPVYAEKGLFEYKVVEKPEGWEPHFG